MIDAQTYIARETRVSIAINTLLSLGFFLAAFGWGRPVPVWGMGQYVFDFLPQAFMVALMSTLVPGFLAGKARRAGKVATYAGASRLPKNLLLRALLLAAPSALLAAAAAAVILAALGLNALPPIPALAAKLIFGAALAAIITPLGLRAALAA